MNILIAGISPSGDVTTQFGHMVWQLQASLSRTNARVTLEMFASLNDALSAFAITPEFDAITAVDADHSVDVPFLTTFPQGKEFVLAAYPLPEVDWNRVKARIASTDEDLDLVGNAYNATPATGATGAAGAYVRVERGGLRIFKMTRKAMDVIVAQPGVAGSPGEARSKLALHCAGIVDGKYLDPDDRLCALFAKEIWMDIASKTSASNVTGFGPCSLITRKVVR